MITLQQHTSNVGTHMGLKCRHGLRWLPHWPRPLHENVPYDSKGSVSDGLLRVHGCDGLRHGERDGARERLSVEEDVGERRRLSGELG